jgi:hypothetical protein
MWREGCCRYRQKKDDLRNEREAHDSLIEDDGRPCYPISYGFDLLDVPKEYEDALWYWNDEWSRFIFQHRLVDWRGFRNWQCRIRDHYNKRNKFSEYQKVVNESQEHAGFRTPTTLLQDRQQQNQLQDWTEYRCYHYQSLPGYKRRLSRAEEMTKIEKAELEKAESRLSQWSSLTGLFFRPVIRPKQAFPLGLSRVGPPG